MDDELSMLSDTCRQFYERECAPHYEEWESAGSFPRELWLKAGEMGLLGAEVPEEYDGLGGSFESPRFHRRPLASFHATISSTSRCA